MTFFSVEKFEIFFSNFSFVCLFLAMITYWFNLTAKFNRQEESDPISSFAIAAPVASIAKQPKGPKQTEQSKLTIPKFFSVGDLGMLSANLSLFILLALRWFESGHFPLSNLYESLMFLSWALTFFHLLLKQMTSGFINTLRKQSSPPGSFLEFGAITAPTALFTTAFANFSLPAEMQHSSALVPALQSNWLMMHVTVMILSYAALIFGSLLSIGFLILVYSIPSAEYEKMIALKNSDNFILVDANSSKNLNRIFEVDDTSSTKFSLRAQSQSARADKKGDVDPLFNFSNPKDDNQEINSLQNQSSLNKNGISSSKLKWAANLDNLSYRMLGIGFPLLTIGILSGAVWANEAWGSYWSWDPKETWALLTWLIFAIYLHTRITKNWQGKKPAMIASFGFFVVWICYLGVNLLGEGLHSYGWLKS